jgi:hypothetical protein
MGSARCQGAGDGEEHGGSGVVRAHHESASRGAGDRQPTRQTAGALAFPQDAAGRRHVKKPKLMQELHGLGGGLEGGQEFPPCPFAV